MGRDHGLPIYGVWENFCFKQFSQLEEASIENSFTLFQLIETFGSLDNTELWVGGLAEERLEDSLLGITFACIFGLTFKNVRDGDRFYFEKPGVFTNQQRQQIFRSSFSRIICDNTDSTIVQPDAFLTNQSRVSCDNTRLIPQISLDAWKLPLCYVRISVPQGRRITSNSRVLRAGTVAETFSNLDSRPAECLPTLCPSSVSVRFTAFSTRSGCIISRTSRVFNSDQPSNNFFIRTINQGDPEVHTSLSSCQQDRTPAITFTCSRQLQQQEGNTAENDPTQNPESSDFTGEVPDELKELLKKDAKEAKEYEEADQLTAEPSRINEKKNKLAEVDDADLMKELENAIKQLN